MSHADMPCKDRYCKTHQGVAAIPNQCAMCGRFKRWEDLTTHFAPDSDYSSESESWRECSDCRARRSPLYMGETLGESRR